MAGRPTTVRGTYESRARAIGARRRARRVCLLTEYRFGLHGFDRLRLSRQSLLRHVSARRLLHGFRMRRQLVPRSRRVRGVPRGAADLPIQRLPGARAHVADPLPRALPIGLGLSYQRGVRLPRSSSPPRVRGDLGRQPKSEGLHGRRYIGRRATRRWWRRERDMQRGSPAARGWAGRRCGRRSVTRDESVA